MIVPHQTNHRGPKAIILPVLRNPVPIPQTQESLPIIVVSSCLVGKFPPFGTLKFRDCLKTVVVTPERIPRPKESGITVRRSVGLLIFGTRSVVRVAANHFMDLTYAFFFTERTVHPIVRRLND